MFASSPQLFNSQDEDISNETQDEDSQPATATQSLSSQTASVLNPKIVSDHGLKPIIQNILSRVDLGCQLSLLNITNRIRTAEYNPGKSLGVCVKLMNPTATFLIFSTGKMIGLRAKSVDDSSLAMRKMTRILQKAGYPEARFYNYSVCNIVFTCDLNFPVNIEDFLQSFGQFCTYCPELFPGVNYRMIRPRIHCIIFVNGALVFTNAKTMEEAQQAIDKMYSILLRFKKKLDGINA